MEGFPAGIVEKGFLVFQKEMELPNFGAASSSASLSTSVTTSLDTSMTSVDTPMAAVQAPLAPGNNGFDQNDYQDLLVQDSSQETQHTKPDWLEKMVRNFDSEVVQQCSSRTRMAVEKNEVLKVFFPDSYEMLKPNK